MNPPDVWAKGTGVTRFKGADRYDKVEPSSPTAAAPVHDILAPCYTGDRRGPPSYESKESYEKGPPR